MTAKFCFCSDRTQVLHFSNGKMNGPPGSLSGVGTKPVANGSGSAILGLLCWARLTFAARSSVKFNTNNRHTCNKMPHDQSNALGWYDLISVFDDKHFAIRGVEKEIPDARFKILSDAPLAPALFELFSWNISVDKPALDVIGNNLGWLIFSTRAKAAIENLPNLSGEFIEFPQSMFKKTKHRFHAWVFHPFTTVRALNLDRSKVVWENYGREDFISVIHELWLNQLVVAKCPTVFRLAEYPSIVLANDDFITAWTNAGCAGLRFKPVHTA